MSDLFRHMGPGPVSRHRPLLTDAQRLDWLRLIRTENVGPATFRQLVNHFGGAAQALEALPELSLRGGRKEPVHPFPRQAAEAEILRAAALGARLVALGEPGYPPWLALVEAPPPLLYVKGRMEWVEQPIVAIVGARNGSALGKKFTRLMAVELGKAGFVIASGLARGIDTAAHEAALERGTIAVIAGGMDNYYPPENRTLQDKIGKEGLLITERPPGVRPRAQDFPRRNRIISGMAMGVLVVEASRRSGSLITARLAGEQGREVFAVPGSPLDPRAEGTNRLIKNGATLVTHVEDMTQVLFPMLGRPQPSATDFDDVPASAPPPPPSSAISEDGRRRVLEALGPAPVEVDEIIRTTGLSPGEVQTILLELDLAGRLQRHGAQLISLL